MACFQRTINRILPAVTVGSHRCGLLYEVSTTSCASYGRLSGHFLKMQVKHWSRRSFPVAWTTATLCSSASRKESVAVGSERRSGYTGTRRSYITPMLRQLHWLPVRQSVDFKVATLVHRSLSSTRKWQTCRTVDSGGHKDIFVWIVGPWQTAAPCEVF